MKKYLWAVMAVLFMSANASGFRDIDIKTHSFLSDLRAASGSDDEFADEEEDAIDAPEVVEVEEAVEEEDVAAEANVSEAGKTEAAAEQAMDKDSKKKDSEKVKEEKKAEVAEAQKEKEALLAEIAAKEEALKKAKAQAEKEKREVEAYEKKRAEKLAKEAQEKAELDKIIAQARATEKALAQEEATKKTETVAKSAEIDLEAEKSAAKDTADKRYLKAVQEMRSTGSEKPAAAGATEKALVQKEAATKKAETVAKSAEIDLEAEKSAAKDTLDKRYFEAVQEMRSTGSEKPAAAGATEKALAQKEAATKKAETVARSTEIDLEAEKSAAKDAADMQYWEAVQEMRKAESGRLAMETRIVKKALAENKTAVKKTEITEIDLDAEKRAAKDAADKAYVEAVQEMDKAE